MSAAKPGATAQYCILQIGGNAVDASVAPVLVPGLTSSTFNRRAGEAGCFCGPQIQIIHSRRLLPGDPLVDGPARTLLGLSWLNEAKGEKTGTFRRAVHSDFSTA
jgi:hypothetical protein